MRRPALPHGTEVVTRVDRVVDGRRVPQGAVGRVVGGDGERLEVLLVGVGQVAYLRDELTPRRAGQLAFAVRRDGAWRALRGNVVLETVVGSRAWGLAGEGSDLDRRGGFVAPFAWSAGLAEAPGELVSADGSETFWEVGKLVRQALRADPNTLETLFVEGARAVDEMGAWLAGILAGNGNHIERVLGPHLLKRAPALAALRPLVGGSLSRRLYRHYRGFAAGVLREADAAERATAKQLLYVLRTALTGAHALLTGRVVTDVNVLAEAHGFGDVRELVATKRAAERVTLEPDAAERWRGELTRAFELLDDARRRSPLPEEPPNRDALEAWLVEARLARV